MDTHALRYLCVVDVRSSDGSSDIAVRDAAAVPVGHDLDLHNLLMVRAVVVHDAQERDFVMRRRPQDSWGVHQIAIVLNIDGQAAILPVCERSAYRGWRAVSDSVATRRANVLIMLVEGP